MAKSGGGQNRERLRCRCGAAVAVAETISQSRNRGEPTSLMCPSAPAPSQPDPAATGDDRRERWQKTTIILAASCELLRAAQPGRTDMLLMALLTIQMRMCVRVLASGAQVYRFADCYVFVEDQIGRMR